MYKINNSLLNVSGIGEYLYSKFKKLEIENIKDLLWHFPFRYEDFSKIKKIIDLKENERAAIQGTIKGISFFRTPKKRMFITEALISDETSSLKAVWFNQPFLRKILIKGEKFNFAGKPALYKGKLSFLSPSFEPAEQELHTIGLVPIYPETKGLTSKGIRKTIKKVLENLEKIPEFLPNFILEKYQFPQINQAIKSIHFPKKITEALKAKQRFVFNDLFLLQLNNLIYKGKLNKQKACKLNIDFNWNKKNISGLPFELTFSQKKALYEILSDLSKTRPMNRLLQGDVGSGKTIVAILSALNAAKQEKQTVFMAPTEILAFQHYQTFKEFFPDFEKGVALLTSSQKKVFWGRNLENENVKKNLLISQIEKNEIKIIFGTQSLIQKQVLFNNLALVVIDEQHRFGVKQRAALCKQLTTIPHFLSMSATPIPRTLALTLFNDLDISILEEMPANRKPIITKIVPSSKRNQAYQFIRTEIKKGNQVFVVYPRIESENNLIWAETPVRNRISNGVKEEYEKLSQEIFPDLNVAMLHGKMKSEEKEKTIKKFKNKEIDILVSTSIIEVGMDIPKATIMLIEGAERFGLAQIYQLRGRVGRRDKQSFCFLFSQSSSPLVLKRLKSILFAKNALELAEMDLEIRGPGEFLGGSQTGMPDLAMKAISNPDLVKIAREEALQCLKIDIGLNSFPQLQEEIKRFYKEVHLE